MKPKPPDWPQNKDWAGRKPGTYQWFELQDAVDYYAEFEAEKIILPAIVNVATAVLDTEKIYGNDNTSIIATGDRFLLALLNHPLMTYLYKVIASTKRGGYFEQKPMYIEQLPIRTIDFDNPADKKAHDTIVKHVETMLQLHRDLQGATLPHDKEQIQRRIEHTDRQIDALVYELYGLTEEEIRIVEGK